MALSKWAQALLPTLTQRFAARGVPASAVPAFAAQLDIETGGGTSYGVRKRNNVAGIGGRGNYRVYGSLEEGLDDYINLLDRRYKNVMNAAKGGDPVIVAKALGNSPWAEHRYRLGASGDEYSGSAGRKGTEGLALIAKLGKDPSKYVTDPGPYAAAGGAVGAVAPIRIADFQGTTIYEHLYGVAKTIPGIDPSSLYVKDGSIYAKKAV